MKRALWVVVLLLSVQPALAAPPNSELARAIQDFQAASWFKVLAAADIIRKQGKDGLDALVALSKSERVVPLKDTADLIYPGAERFYGHGYVLSYELNHVGDRAGWLLEDISKRAFGFETDDWVETRKPEVAGPRRVWARAAAAVWVAGQR